MMCRQSCRVIKMSAITFKAPVEQMLDRFYPFQLRNASPDNTVAPIRGTVIKD